MLYMHCFYVILFYKILTRLHKNIVIRGSSMFTNNGNQQVVTGKVKWFSQFKGYGFIEAENISEDIFLHFSIIDKSGINKLNNEDIIVCSIEKSDRGYQVINIIEIIYSNKQEIPNKQPEKVIAVMKWFNPVKGFGFAQMSSGEDVFIHSNLLKKNKLDTIAHGKKIVLMVRHTNFGYEALDIVAEYE